MRLRWLGEYSFVLEAAGKIILVDPKSGLESDYPVADIIVITQWHFAHCNLGLVRSSMDENTHVISTPQVDSLLHPCGVLDVGESRRFGPVEIFGMPVLNPRPGIKPGSKPQQQFGFVLHAEGKKLYFIGDSDYIDGMDEISPDVLLVPVGGTVTLNASDAAGITKLISPKLAVPVMWGGFVGSRDDAIHFCELLPDIKCNVIDPGEVIEI